MTRRMNILNILTRRSLNNMHMRNVFFVVLLGFLGGCGERPAPVVKIETPGMDTVKVFVLRADSVKKNISLPGELSALEDVQIRAKVQGYVRRMNVDIGSKVRKGDVLAMIDAPEIDTRVQELNERVQAAKAKYQSSKDYFDRIDKASHADGVIAPSEWQRTKNQMLGDSAEYHAALLAAASLRQTGDYLTILAPFSGTVSKRNIVVGSFVGNTGDQPLFELEDNSVLRLRVAVPEAYTSALLAGNTGELTTRSLPDKKFKAVLKRRAGLIDNATRTEVWEFEVPNADGELKAGGYADVKMLFLRSKPSLIVPASAMVTTLERRFVIRVDSGVTRWVDVRPGFNMGDRSEVFGDLKAGDTLVLKGNEELKAGTRIYRFRF
jgi:membrane fusion protein (multidrug efflux system)